MSKTSRIDPAPAAQPACPHCKSTKRSVRKNVYNSAAHAARRCGNAWHDAADCVKRDTVSSSENAPAAQPTRDERDAAARVERAYQRDAAQPTRKQKHAAEAAERAENSRIYGERVDTPTNPTPWRVELCDGTLRTFDTAGAEIVFLRTNESRHFPLVYSIVAAQEGNYLEQAQQFEGERRVAAAHLARCVAALELCKSAIRHYASGDEPYPTTSDQFMDLVNALHEASAALAAVKGE